MEIIKTKIPIYKGIDQNSKSLPILIADSNKKGPIVWITAGIHGNEITGTSVIQTVFRNLKNNPLIKGKIFAFPIMNPSGFENNTRNEPHSQEDLNRTFDIETPSTSGQYLTKLILKTILNTKPDYLLDLHTDTSNSIAYSIVDYPPNVNTQTLNRVINLAKQIRLPWGIDTEKNSGYPLYMCLSGQLMRNEIPSLTIELGGPNLIINKYKKIGVKAIFNLLYQQKMINNYKTDKQKFQEKRLFLYEEIYTNTSGLLEYIVKPGQTIKKGKILAIIRNIFGEKVEILKSPVNGILFSHCDQSVVFPGEILFTLGVTNEPT